MAPAFVLRKAKIVPAARAFVGGKAEPLTPAVETRGVAKHYGSLVALESLTLTVDPGEVLGVLGPNGAGKTTAIRVLTTIFAPDRGRFSVAGFPHTADRHPQTDRRPRRAPAIRTGRPARSTCATTRGCTDTRASARTIALSLLAEMGLADRRRSLISTYSRGMRQRLGIARALVNDPSVVFLDEPTLDPAGQRQVLKNVRGIASERGAAVLLSTHLLTEVEENCSRVLIINRGRVVAEGTVAEIVRKAAAPRSGRLHVAPEHSAAPPRSSRARPRWTT